MGPLAGSAVSSATGLSTTSRNAAKAFVRAADDADAGDLVAAAGPVAVQPAICDQGFGAEWKNESKHQEHRVAKCSQGVHTLPPFRLLD